MPFSKHFHEHSTHFLLAWLSEEPRWQAQALRHGRNDPTHSDRWVIATHLQEDAMWSALGQSILGAHCVQAGLLPCVSEVGA